MLFSFSKKSPAINLSLDNLIHKIENCANFSKLYSLKAKPTQLIETGELYSVVFRTAVNAQDQTDTFEYWVKGSDNKATYYTIVMSTQDKQVDSIRDEFNYSISSSSLKFNQYNELYLVFNTSIKM